MIVGTAARSWQKKLNCRFVQGKIQKTLWSDKRIILSSLEGEKKRKEKNWRAFLNISQNEEGTNLIGQFFLPVFWVFENKTPGDDSVIVSIWVRSFLIAYRTRQSARRVRQVIFLITHSTPKSFSWTKVYLIVFWPILLLHTVGCSTSVTCTGFHTCDICFRMNSTFFNFSCSSRFPVLDGFLELLTHVN